MLVLALDTTTKRGSCAAVRDGHVLGEDTSDSAREHAARLPTDLMALLARLDLDVRRIDVFAVATGPGSFTGLRIGIATMQGLAFACGRPLVGISTLDALATIARAPRTATWVDAWRGEVYAAIYVHGRALGEPVVAAPAALLSEVSEPTTFIGDGAATYQEIITRVGGALVRTYDPVTPPLAGTIGLLATQRTHAGERPQPHAIRPIYVRRPDALLAREAHGAD